MHDREPGIGERVAEPFFELRREADLGHEDQRLLSIQQHLRREMQIDLGLAASRHAVQQIGVESSGDAVYHSFLIASERMRRHEARAWRARLLIQYFFR